MSIGVAFPALVVLQNPHRRTAVRTVEDAGKQLEKLVVSAYEDKVKGIMPEALCVQLMNRYEDERRGQLEQRTQLTFLLVSLA